MSHVPCFVVVGSLMYSMVCTYLDIANAVSVVSRDMSNHRKEHQHVVKWILRYLRVQLIRIWDEHNKCCWICKWTMQVTLIEEDQLHDMYLVWVIQIRKLLCNLLQQCPQLRQSIWLSLRLLKKLSGWEVYLECSTHIKRLLFCYDSQSAIHLIID